MGIATTFSMVVVAWVFFRAESLDHATSYLARWGQGGLKLNIQCGGVPVDCGHDGMGVADSHSCVRTWFTSPRRGMVLLRWSAYSCCAWFVVKHLHSKPISYTSNFEPALKQFVHRMVRFAGLL